MIGFCVTQWDKNKEKLREALKVDTTLNSCDYMYLVQKVVEHILNDEELNLHYEYEKWDYNRITKIDNGDYQGTLLFLIPRATYQPSESDYLMTFVTYGSCSGCDTLHRIQSWCNDEPPTAAQLEDYMTLCLHLVQNMIMPYNKGFDYNKDFDEAEF